MTAPPYFDVLGDDALAAVKITLSEVSGLVATCCRTLAQAAPKVASLTPEIALETVASLVEAGLGAMVVELDGEIKRRRRHPPALDTAGLREIGLDAMAAELDAELERQRCRRD